MISRMAAIPASTSSPCLPVDIRSHHQTVRAPNAHTDRFVDVAEALGNDAKTLVDRVRTAMAPDPLSVHEHGVAMAAYVDALQPFLPIDVEGELVNRLVADR